MDAATSNRAYDNHEKHVEFMIFRFFPIKVLGEKKIDERKNDIVCRYIED